MDRKRKGKRLVILLFGSASLLLMEMHPPRFGWTGYDIAKEAWVTPLTANIIYFAAAALMAFAFWLGARIMPSEDKRFFWLKVEPSVIASTSILILRFLCCAALLLIGWLTTR